MINSEQTIPCPTCKTKIPFDVQQLLMGAKFTCPTCLGIISLASESKEVVQETMTKFDQVKDKVLKMKGENKMS